MACPQCGATETVDEGSEEHQAMVFRGAELEAGAAPSAAEVREWARAHEIEVADGGPIPQAVLDQFEAAHGGGEDDET